MEKKDKKNSILSKSVYGTLFLIIRQTLVQLMNFIGSIFLARFLSVEDYGFYGVLFFLLSFIINFGDIGLAASLIRQKSKPLHDEERTIFTIQCLLSFLIFILLFLIGPQLCKFYNLSQDYLIFFNLLSLSILILVFKTIPTVRLERNLQFGWLSVIEIIQAASYNSIAVLLSYLNYGPYSFCIALLVRSLIGSVLVNIIAPFPVKFKFNLKILKRHLKFGIPYQLTVYVNLAKDSISPVLIGAILGLSKTGIVNMASTIAAFPVLLITILNRLFFSAFSRVRDNKKELNFLFRMGVRICNAFAACLAVFVLIMNEPFIKYVVGSKWLVINPLFYLLWTANLTIPTMLISTSLMNALGYPRFILKYSILWAIITLGFGGGLVFKLGIYSFGIANILVNLSMILMFFEIKKYLKISIFKEFLSGWIPVVVPAILLYTYSQKITINLFSLIVSFLIFSIVNFLLFLIFSYKDIKIIILHILEKNAISNLTFNTD